MKLYIKQKIFTWFASYDVFNENNEIEYRIRGKMDWGRNVDIFKQDGRLVGNVKQQALAWLTTVHLNLDGQSIGRVRREWSWFRPKFKVEYNDWQIEGDFLRFNYVVKDATGNVIITCQRKWFTIADAYEIDIANHVDPVVALMMVMAIDLCLDRSRNNS